MLYNLTISKAIQPRIRCQWVASAAVDFFDSRLGKMKNRLREQQKKYKTIPNNNLNFKLFLFHIFCRCKLLASRGFDWHPEAVNLDERAGAFAAKVVSKTSLARDDVNPLCFFV